MNTSRFRTAYRLPSSDEPSALAPATTTTTPANASAANPSSRRERRSPNMRVASSRIRTGCNAGMSVALTIDVSWNDAKPKMKLSAKHTPAGNAITQQPPRDAAADEVRERDRDHGADQHAPEHDRVERRVDALHEQRAEAPREHRQRDREQRQAAASVLHGHPGTLTALSHLTARQIRGYVLAHDRDPRGNARLRHPAAHPVEEQDVRRRVGAVGDAGRPRPRHAHRRRARLLLRGGVRPHRDPRVARLDDGHLLAGLHHHAVVARRADRAHRAAVARVRAPLPPPARRGEGVRHPRLPHRRSRHRGHRRRSRRGRVRGARCRPRAPRQARRGEAARC